MKKVKLYCVLTIGWLLCAATIQAHAQNIPGTGYTPDPGQIATIQNVLDKIKELKKDIRGDHEQTIKELYKIAIKLTDQCYLVFPPDNVEGGEAEFDPNLEKDYDVKPMKGKKAKIRLGRSAFELSPGWLASAKMQAFFSARQIEDDRWPPPPENPWQRMKNPEDVKQPPGEKDEFNPNEAEIDAEKERQSLAGAIIMAYYRAQAKYLKRRIINEIESCDMMIGNAYKLGLNDFELGALKLVRIWLFDALDEANQKKVTNFKENGQPYRIDILPDSAKSIKTLTGNTELFVAGNVLSEERMQVTIRGTKTIQGNVVTAELNGKTTEAKTDKEGHAFLDMSAIASGLTGTAVATIKILDSKGMEISRATTMVQPGYPMIFDRPQISQLPDNIPIGELVTIPGKNLGADANLVVGEQFQETLSASDKEMTVFTDCKTGIQPAYVITTNGVSQSQDVNIYSLDFSLPKSSITPKENVQAMVHYESIPVGTKLIFTNKSPETIKMTIPGGQNAANECVYTVSITNGTIPVNVIGIMRGNFQIALDMNFKNDNQTPK